jgi:poly(3-hydroxybutyrate) depolymerase
MIKKFCYSLAAIATLILSYVQVHAQQTAKITSAGIAYLEYLPQGYSSNSNKYPIVISLHGISERGTTSTDRNTQLTDVLRVANVGLPHYVKLGTQYPFILISPQLKTSYGNWPADYVMQVLNYVKTYLRIDDRRIYITGLSLGGGGTWTTACANPGVFAAIAPVCGANNVLSKACDLASNKVPVWAFHGDADKTVNYTVTTKMVAAINACSNPKPDPMAKMTIYPGMSHIIWDKAYKESTVLNWMLSYTKGTTSGTTTPTQPTTTNQAPVASAGGDQTVTLPQNAVALHGSGHDPDGTLQSLTWSQVSGPNTAGWSNKGSASPTVTSLVAGTYTFRLTAKDSKGATSTDDTKVTVNGTSSSSSSTTYPTNQAPIARAGGDIVKWLPINSASIAGSGSDPDGSVASYQWTQVSGPNHPTLVRTNAPVFSFSNVIAGTYVFRLKVTDNKGASATDDMVLTIKPAGVASN